MSSTKSAPKNVVQSLADYLLAEMPSIKSVAYNFPEPNEALEYPSLTVFARTPQIRMIAPYTISKTIMNDEKQSLVLRCIGFYDFTLQVDIWTSYKIEREKLNSELLAAFSKSIEKTGVQIKMADYHNEYCDYALGDELEFVEDEQGSQRGEWRLRCTVQASCRAVREMLAYVMEEIENNIEVLDEVEALDVPDYFAPV